MAYFCLFLINLLEQQLEKQQKSLFHLEISLKLAKLIVNNYILSVESCLVTVSTKQQYKIAQNLYIYIQPKIHQQTMKLNKK